MVKKRRGIKLPYNKQGLIYFTCINEKDMSDEDKEKLKKICMEVAGEEYAEALYAMVTDDKLNVDGVARRYHTSATRLYKRRQKFYMQIAPRIKMVITDE